jgi:hypothetical protein
MSFLAPLFLLGALAVALPVVFHLIRRSSRERVPFSSLMFLVPTPPRVTRRSRIENWFLLLLRCLVICLLAAAFARPFLSSPAIPLASSQSAQKTLILLDTSASMRRGNLWPQAKERAASVLRQASPGDQVACFTFDRQTRPVVTFDEWSAHGPGERVALVLQRLEAITPGWASTQLGHAFITAAEAFDSADLEQSAGRVVLISDLQEGSRLDGLQGFEWPRDLEVVVEPLSAPGHSNAGVQLVADRDDIEKTSTQPVPRLRVSNSSDAKREQFRIGWGRPNAPGTLAAIDVYVPPGQSRIFPAPNPPPDASTDRLILTGDDHDFDNTVFLAPPQAEQARILFLGNDNSSDSTQPLFYVQRAFQKTRRLDVQVIARNPAAPIIQDDVAGTTLLIIADSLPDGRIQFARTFLEQGGTVLMPLANLEMVATLNRILDTVTLPADEATPAKYAMLSQIDFDHPLFAPFADPRFSDFTKIHFWKHRRVSFDQIHHARIAARFDNGDAALVQIPARQGSLFVLTSGWQPDDSQLALSSKFVPLLYSILEQSGGLKDQRTHYFVGDTITLPIQQDVTLRKPDGSEATVKAGESFAGADQPGIYVAQGEPSIRFAVNVAPEESRTAPMPIEHLERIGVPLKQQPRMPARLEQQRQQHLLASELESRQKFWRWLIVVALVILVLETCLAGRLTRRTAHIAQG